jgi:hypothetical protein
MRQYRVLLRGQGTSIVDLYWAGCIINMSGFDLRQAQVHAHHVVPLGEQFDRGFRDPYHEHEWLCPNHHAMLHLWIDDEISDLRRGRRAASTFDDISKTDYGAIVEGLRVLKQRKEAATNG